MLLPLSAIKQRRRKLGWTQKELAQRSGVSQSTIAKIENGRLVPSYEIASKIFEALDRGEAEIAGNDAIAKNVMTTKVIKTSPDEMIGKVTHMMKSYAISQIPVVDNGKVLGLVTERNIIEAFEKHGADVVNIRVGEIMDSPPPIVREDTYLPGIVELLKQYPAVLVMDGEKIKGIITKADIVYIGIRLR